jgi:outer membrane protein OmpA-like peptidoglycan-associated protein
MRYIDSSFSRLSRAAITGVLMITALVGCGSSSSSSSSSSLAGTCITNQAAPLAVAIGARSNVPEANIPDFVTSLVEAAANAGQQISFVRIDGQPKIFTLPLFTTNAQNSAARQQALVEYVNQYVGPILTGEIRAKVAQADVLSALDLAASATGPNGNIIVLDSGLQTVAPLNYQQSGLLMAPPSDVVAFVRQKNLLPALSGRHVLLDGFGYAASPQPALNEAQRDNVVRQWEAIVKVGGGCVTADTLPNTAAAIAGLPPVSIVTPPTTPSFSNCGTFVLEDASTVGFVVGTSTFRDPSAAQATLGRLADTLKHGTEHITLIGSTSSEGGDALNDRLSLARAKAVESVLVSMGIQGSRVTTVGAGSHWSGRVNDIGPGGVLLPGPAETDREVIVQLPQCA